MQSSRREALANGDMYYLTGKPCAKGHTVKRYTTTASCVGCIAEHGRAYQKRGIRFVKLTHKQIADMKHAQWSCCAICLLPFGTIPKNMCLDHDHTNKQMRGLLCAKCNFGLGQFNDNPALLNAAANYLRKYK